MTEIGTSETIKTSETYKDGMKIIERLNIVRNWKTMTKTSKYAIIGYCMGFVATLSFYTYNDGKKALLNKRLEDAKNNRIINDSNTIYEEEWIAVKEGCKKNRMHNFFSSLVFPASLISEIFPSIIMRINKK